MNTEQDATEFWNEVRRLEQQNESPEPVYEYRLYYDDSGKIVSGQVINQNSSTTTADQGQYLVVSKDEYDNCANKIVKNAVLVKNVIKLDFDPGLEISTAGYRVVKNNAALTLDEEESYSNVQHYDRKTS